MNKLSTKDKIGDHVLYSPVSPYGLYYPYYLCSSNVTIINYFIIQIIGLFKYLIIIIMII